MKSESFKKIGRLAALFLKLMITFLSLVTSVKDYVEIVHKLIESDSSFKTSNYDDFGPIITYILMTFQELFRNILTLKWLNNFWDLSIVIPDISSAMISEISILDGYFHNAFNFLDKPISYGETNFIFYTLEKFGIGLINSLFLFIPTGISHLITIRRFVMQGLEAGYLAGLGSIFGNIFWITSVIFGFRFFVIPWLSFDIFRYILGFVLLVKYMWDSYNERKMVVKGKTDPVKIKIFLLNFLLALTEQTSIYPFITNLSIGSESSILESFPAQNITNFMTIHCSYILGLTLGCFSLLHLTCWFWENPAFKIYMWLISSFKVSTSFYYKVLNFTFLYLTMICAISSIPYYGLDYTLTNPLGLVQDDRILYQTETLMKAPHLSFLGTKASDRNTRRNRGRHGRRERWKRRIRKYRTFDASLYDQGTYDLFTIEDLNYGFDRFWLRRKMRNHRVRFRFFPGSWMRSIKKQLAKPRLESYAGPRQEFFRILFEQVYHPSFHVYSTLSAKKKEIGKNKGGVFGLAPMTSKKFDGGLPAPWDTSPLQLKRGLQSQGGPPDIPGRDTPTWGIPSGIPLSRPVASNLGLTNQKDLSFFFKNDSIANPFYLGAPTPARVREFIPLTPPRGGNKKEDGVSQGGGGLLRNQPNWRQAAYACLWSTKGKTGRGPYQIKSSIYSNNPRQESSILKDHLKVENSTLRKFVRKMDLRIKTSEIQNNEAAYAAHLKNTKLGILSRGWLRSNLTPWGTPSSYKNPLYSKRWKQIFSKMSHLRFSPSSAPPGRLRPPGIKASRIGLLNPYSFNYKQGLPLKEGGDVISHGGWKKLRFFNSTQPIKKQNSQIHMSNQDQQILKYRSIYLNRFMYPPNEAPPPPRRGGGESYISTSVRSPGVSTKSLGAPDPKASLFQGYHLAEAKVPLSGPPTNPNLNLGQVPLKKLSFGGLRPYPDFATLFHPLKFYQKKQQAFEKKLHYYTPTVFRKFSIENNAPFFRVMMKRYFYYYKPTLRWERTMKVASLRKARRKTPSSPRKIQFADLGVRGGFTPPAPLLSSKDEVSQRVGYSPSVDQRNTDLNNFARKTIPTHNYTIVGKRASRYRYQIYKDVLQHWYYTPFNRLLLKFDVDLFIKRQPNSHFLTKNEENLLHLRRFLLAEHYNTLRWYTQMEHYRSMKTKIGNTKSFGSGFYNQQFSGTFKKIRHLFAITPSQTNQTILKFDQPLYNEFLNNSTNSYQKNLVMHEELFTNAATLLKARAAYNYRRQNEVFSFLRREKEANRAKSTGRGPSPNEISPQLGVDLLNQSTQIIRDYLKITNPIKQKYIKSLLEQKNYVELTNFLYKGKKTRGLKPITNYSDFLNQEKEYLLGNPLIPFNFKTEQEAPPLTKRARGKDEVTQALFSNQPQVVRLPDLESAKKKVTPFSEDPSLFKRGWETTSLPSIEKQVLPRSGTPNLTKFADLKETEKLKLDDGVLGAPAPSWGRGPRPHYFRSVFPTNLWIHLLKKWKRKINDQEFLKNYLQRRVEKREKRQLKKEKNIQTKLQHLETTGFLDKNKLPLTIKRGFYNYPLKRGDEQDKKSLNSIAEPTPSELLNETQVTTGIQKALSDGLVTLLVGSQGLYPYSDFATTPLKNLKYQLVLKKEKELSISLNQLSKILKQAKDHKTRPSAHLYGMVRTKSLGAPAPSWDRLGNPSPLPQTLPNKDETSLTIIRGGMAQPPKKNRAVFHRNKFMNLQNIWKTPSLLRNQVCSTGGPCPLMGAGAPPLIPIKFKDIYKNYKLKSQKFLKTKILKIFTKRHTRQNSFKNWQAKERRLNKQKRMRKEFKLVSKKPFKYDSKNYSKYFNYLYYPPSLSYKKTSSNWYGGGSPPRREENEAFKPLPQVGAPLKARSFPGGKRRSGALPLNSNISSAQVKKLSNYIFENSSLKSLENVTDTTPSRKKYDGSRWVEKQLFFKSDSTANSLAEINKTQEILVAKPRGKNEVAEPTQSSAFQTQVGVAKPRGKIENSSKLYNFSWNEILKKTYSKYWGTLQSRVSKKFKRKKSPQRRVRIRKNRAVIKKRTLNDSLKREFKNLRRYNQTLEMNKAQLAAFSFTGEPLLNNQIFKPSPLQRRAKQKKQRFWKQKRGKYAQKLRKYRKRRRSVLGKIRILNKQLKKIQATTDLKNWWWRNFLPNIRATTDSLWQYEKERQIQQKLLELSVPDILERDKLSYQLSWVRGGLPPHTLAPTWGKDLGEITPPEGGGKRVGFANNPPWKTLLRFFQKRSPSSNSKEINSLQIGDFDYKPLALPEALRIRNAKENEVSQRKPGRSEGPYPKDFAKQSLIPSNISLLQTESSNNKLNTKSPNDFVKGLTPGGLRPNKNEKLSLSGGPLSPAWGQGALLRNQVDFLNNKSKIEQNKTDIISRVTESYLLSKASASLFEPKLGAEGSLEAILTNPIPFYAGWDDLSRKFVITNRLLSRRESGYEMRFQNLPQTFEGLGAPRRFFQNHNPLKTKALAAKQGALAKQDPTVDRENPVILKENETTVGLTGLAKQDRAFSIPYQSKEAPDSDILLFTAAPLKGMNTATTLYWQIPFTTYDPDQFFALGMDGFAPLGWRRFQFRHSILKSWLYEKTVSKGFEKLSFGGLRSYPCEARAPAFFQKGRGPKTELNKKAVNLQNKIPASNNYIVKNKTNIQTNLSSFSATHNFEFDQMDGVSQKRAPLFNIKTNWVRDGNTPNPAHNLEQVERQTPGTSNLTYKLKEKNSIAFWGGPALTWVRKAKLFKPEDREAAIRNKKTQNIYRRLKKRYRRVKKHPRSPVWFPSGPLLNQVLPVHYIYIFYKRSRLPRDRYIKKRLIKSKVQTNLLAGNLATNTIFTEIPDFTLRKRVKTKRKYHIKQDLTKQLTLIPRRVKFIGDYSIDLSPPLRVGSAKGTELLTFPNMRWRPLSRQKLNKPIPDIIKEKRVLRSKQRKKELQELNSKQPANLRIKQLRRRVQRQIIRSVSRYKPRSGGFVWPGDYLKLELVKTSKLDSVAPQKTNSETLTSRTGPESTLSSFGAPAPNLGKVVKTHKRKKKRSIQEWQIQPKKYMFQKHNYNVLKRKLKKAYRINKIQERTKELALMV